MFGKLKKVKKNCSHELKHASQSKLWKCNAIANVRGEPKIIDKADMKHTCYAETPVPARPAFQLVLSVIHFEIRRCKGGY